MKKNLLLLSSLISFFFVSAQKEMHYGINAGSSVSNWQGDAVNTLSDIVDFTNGMVDMKPTTGLYFGSFVALPLSDKIAVEPGIYYAEKGFSMKGELSVDKLEILNAFAKAEVKSRYVDLPVMFSLEPSEGLKVFAGPQFSYLLKSNLIMKAGLLGINLLKEKMDITNQFNRWDIGLSGGASYTFTNGFQLKGSYEHGLQKLDQNGSFSAYNRGFKAGIGYRF